MAPAFPDNQATRKSDEGERKTLNRLIDIRAEALIAVVISLSVALLAIPFENTVDLFDELRLPAAIQAAIPYAYATCSGILVASTAAWIGLTLRKLRARDREKQEQVLMEQEREIFEALHSDIQILMVGDDGQES